MKYLTRSYVQFLGLEIVPFHMPRNHGHTPCPDGGTLPLPDPSRWAEGVVLDGVSYRREDDGLAFVAVASSRG